MSSIRRVLVVTGAIGCATGMFLAPSWQDVIEPAQVLAGLVTYPPGNPVSLYSTHTWTLLHQIPALLLRLGVSERTLAVMLSGVTGMVSFQALGITSLAVGGDAMLACILPFFTYSVQAATGGVGYPVYLLGWPYTSGSIALSWLLLSLALMGADVFAGGLFLLALMPAVHVTLGAWGLIIAALAALASEPEVRARLLAARWWFVAGLILTTVSAVIHQMLFGRPGSLAADPSSYFVAVMTFWDNHRRPFARLSIGAAPFLICVLGSAIWLRWYRSDLPAAARFLLRALLVSAALGLAWSVLLAIDPMVFRFWLWRAMPSRLMNLPLLGCMPVVAGLAARYRGQAWSQVILAAIMVVLTVVLAIDSTVVGFASSYSMLAAVLALAYARSRARFPSALSPEPSGLRPEALAISPKSFAVRLSRNLSPARALTLAVSFVLLMIGGWQAVTGFQTRLSALTDRTSSGVFTAVAARPGVLLTASNLHLVQLRTRRPVLIDGGALDALAYVPEAAPETARVLQRVYGVDLLAPGFPSREGRGELPHDAGRNLWQMRSIDEWRTIGVEFGVTDVLTFDDWTLALPVIARGEHLLLYSIPVR